MADRNCVRFKCLMTSSEISLEAVSSVSQIPAAEWDACANPGAGLGALNGLQTLTPREPKNGACVASDSSYNPFVSHAFFAALEAFRYSRKGTDNRIQLFVAPIAAARRLEPVTNYPVTFRGCFCKQLLGV